MPTLYRVLTRLKLLRLRYAHDYTAGLQINLQICPRPLAPLISLKHRGFPSGSDGKESACSAGDLGLIPGLGRSPGEGKGYPLQYFGLENSMNYTVHGVTKSRT